MNLTKEPARTKNKAVLGETMSLNKALEKIESADTELLEIRKLRDAKLTSPEVSFNDLRKESADAIGRWTINPIVGGGTAFLALNNFHASGPGLVSVIAASVVWYVAGVIFMFKNNENPLRTAKYLAGKQYRKYVEHEEVNQRMNILVNEEYEKQKQGILKKSKKALKAANLSLKEHDASITYSDEPGSEGFKITANHALTMSKWDALRYHAVLEGGLDAITAAPAKKELTA